VEASADVGKEDPQGHSVPGVVSRAEAARRSPVRDERLAWRYLRPESRIRRCNETLEIFSVRLGRRLLDIDVALPSSPRSYAEWMVPVAFLGKDPVAPDLKVRDGKGEAISPPNLQENMAMTCAALRLLAADTGVKLDGILADLVHEVVFEEPFDADIALSLLEEEAPQAEPLFSLLGKLVDQFLLWLPLEGPAGSHHQVSIARRAPRRPDPVLRPSVEEVSFSYELPDGWADFVAEISVPPHRLDLGEIFDRLLLSLGLRVIEIESELDDTSRFASYHHCVRAPRGFVVREVRVGCLRVEGPGGDPREVEQIGMPTEAPEREDAIAVPTELEEERRARGDSASGSNGEDDELELEQIDPGPGLLVQGHDSEIAHVHCSREENVSPLIVRTTLAASAHLMSLWTLAVVLTAAMLWLFERRGLSATTQTGRLEVAAGALLLVPTLAAAWAIRSDESAATRMVLSGTRLLLLLCAALSVSAALTLARILPTEFGSIAALELYATFAYVSAVVLTASWVLSLRPTWYLYRHWLRTPSSHLRATAALAALAALSSLLARLTPASRYVAAVLLLVLGLCFVAVAANRIGARLSEPRGPAPALAAMAGMLAFLCAGYWLDYYDDLAPAALVQLASVSALALLGAAACGNIGSFGRRESNDRGEGSSPGVKRSMEPHDNDAQDR
jgi:hypothetical protein